MELRSDIAAAAARMTSAYDVNREIRHLAAYLREGETVQRLASGVYGAGAGLLAVTDHRVLLLRDGRSGQASEGFPVERLSSAEWVVDGGRGTIAVSDSNSVAELRDVPLADGEEVVGFVRALMNRGNGGASHPRIWPGMPMPTTPGRPDAPATVPAGARQNGNGRPADAGGPYTSPSMPRVPVPPLQIPRRVLPAAATMFTEGAVPVTLLSRSGTIPSQQASAESSAPQVAVQSNDTQSSAVQSNTMQPGAAQFGAVRSEAVRSGAEQSGAVQASAAQPVVGTAGTPPAAMTSDAQATMPPTGTQTAMSPMAPAPVPEGVQAEGPTGAHAAPPPSAQATTAMGVQGGTPPNGTVPGAPAGTVSVPPVGAYPPVNTYAGAPVGTYAGAPVGTMPGYPATGAAPAHAQPGQAPGPVMNGHGRHSDTIGVPSMFAGEVPISQLAAEETATQIALPAQLIGGAEMAATTTTIGAVGAPVKADTPASAPTGTQPADGAGEADERPQPIAWRVPDQTLTGAVRRIQVETTEAIRPPRRVEAKNKLARATPGRPKKWVWMGAAAAALVALAAVGGTKLIAQQHSEAAAPVNPAPAAVDSPAGPRATVTKVLDGDTVEVAGSEVNGTVEVLGIVAPRLDKNQCGAAAAKTFALHELENTPVTVVSDPAQPATSRTGHRLAFLKLPNGADYSVLATQNGLARFYDSPQAAKMANDIKAAESEAQGRHAGLWGPPCNLKPSASGDASTGTGGGNASPARTG